MNDLIIHVKSSGDSYQSGRSKCERQLHKLQRLLDEGYEMANARKKPEDEGFKVIITCFGPMKVTIEEYNEHCKGF